MPPVNRYRIAVTLGCLFALLGSTICGALAAGLDWLTAADRKAIGMRVWHNECGGRVEGLTSWNAGEEFPSLGIGHFIWYPAGVKGPFDESFPRLTAFLVEHGTKLPSWLTPSTPAPWTSRDQFLQEINSQRTTELRNMLASTVALQTQFIIQRLHGALPKILIAAPGNERAKIKHEFDRVIGSGKAGAFALIDYVNFKGEGIVETERYNGQGWGLLQVLAGMQDTNDPVHDFAESAKRALTTRVQNSPPARHESRWLPGWLKRVAAYTTTP